MNSLGRIGGTLERQTIRWACSSNRALGRIRYYPVSQSRSTSSSSTGPISSSGPSASSGGSSSRPKSSRKVLYLLAIPIALLPFTLFSNSRQPLDPYIYSDHKVGSSSQLTPQHALLTIPLSTSDADTFRPRKNSAQADAGDAGDGDKVVIHHLMVKNPDIQIERPYTPINDVGNDGEVQMVIKRVKSGEVGRMVHALKADDAIGIRGPLETLSIKPNQYDRIVMISTGTGVAPFLQFLRKYKYNSQIGSPELHLIHSQSRDPTAEFLTSPGVFPTDKSVTIHRPPPGNFPTKLLEDAVAPRKEGKRVLVLVCLPQSLMRPLCGGLTMDLKQGPITGTLGQMGLTNAEVIKLE